MIDITEHIARIAKLLEAPLQEKLWEYAELLYVEQIVFESTDPSNWGVESPIASALTSSMRTTR